MKFFIFQFVILTSTFLSFSQTTEITFQRETYGHENHGMDGIDTVFVTIDGHLSKVWNKYDFEFYILDHSKKTKTNYYLDYFDSSKLYYLDQQVPEYKKVGEKETKNILGKKCFGNVFVSEKDTLIIYYTSELKVNFNYLPTLKLKGAILEIEIRNKYQSMIWKAIDIQQSQNLVINYVEGAENDESDVYKKRVNARFPNGYEEPHQFIVGEKAPSFSVKDMNGKSWNSEELKGKVIVLNFWFIGCTGCVAEIPTLNKIRTKFSNDDVVFLAITNDFQSDLRRFMSKKNFNFNIIPLDQKMTLDYGIIGFPSTIIIIDKKGDILESYYFKTITETPLEGHVLLSDIEQVIESGLKEK